MALRLSTRWLRIPEPKAVSFLVGAGYLAFTLGGLSTVFSPPRTIVSAGGDTLMLIIGLLLLLGGLISIVAGWADFWQLERVGNVSVGVGVLAYAYIVLVLHLTEDGSRLLQLSLIVVALIFLLLRLAMIWRYDFKPRG